MFEIRQNGADRLDIEFGGKLDSDEMRRALDELVSKSEGIENGRMLFRVLDYKLPTLGAIVLELSRFFELMKMIRRFDRAALIADQGWVRRASELEAAVIPGLEIKAFEPGDEAAAEAWLAS